MKKQINELATKENVFTRENAREKTEISDYSLSDFFTLDKNITIEKFLSMLSNSQILSIRRIFSEIEKELYKNTDLYEIFKKLENELYSEIRYREQRAYHNLGED